MMRSILVAFLLLGTLLISFAVAQPDPGDGPTPTWVEDQSQAQEDPVDLGTKLFNAIKSGNYWYALGAFLGLLTFGFRRLLAWKKINWFQTDRGGLAAIGITSLLSLSSVSLLAMQAPSLALLWGVLAGTVTAMGGYVGIKKLFWPKDA